MQATILGSGSALPVATRVQSGVLLEHADRLLLVDVGSGMLHRLAEPVQNGGAEQRFAALDAVLLTHHHLDHIADLLPLLKARWLAGAESLSIVGPPGTDALVARLVSVHSYLADRLAFDVTELDPGSEAEVEGVSLSTRETRHSMRCFAYRLRTDAGSLVVSGDTEADPGLVEWADGADALVHDCSFPDGMDVSNHPTPTALGDALSGADVGTVYLTHLYPMADRLGSELADPVRDRYDGPVVVASDGTTVEI